MPTHVADAALDAILALQLTVAWAGEGRCAPRRLGWWDTDLVDDAGGGDFLARLLPQTHRWAALEAVREAARRVDDKARVTRADRDKLRTLFFLGFDIDEQVGDRLAALKRAGRPPAEALAFPVPLTADFSTDTFAAALQGDRPGAVTFATVPNGRQMKGAPPGAPEVLVRQLCGALFPLAAEYPLPFFVLGG